MKGQQTGNNKTTGPHSNPTVELWQILRTVRQQCLLYMIKVETRKPMPVYSSSSPNLHSVYSLLKKISREMIHFEPCALRLENAYPHKQKSPQHAFVLQASVMLFEINRLIGMAFFRMWPM